VQILKKVIFILILLLVVLTIAINYKIENERIVIVDIPKGSSATLISKILKENDLILNEDLFNLYSRVLLKDKAFRAGEYKFDTRLSIYDIAVRLIAGDVFYRKLTLVPGTTISDILKLGNSEGLVNDLVGKPQDISKKFDIDLKEGIFFPDTYYYLKGDKFSSILINSSKKWKSKSKELWDKRKSNLPYKNLSEAITLASIIEKEGLEKRKIASVFINRIKRNMKLQSDPTVIYALGKNFDGNLTKKNLRIDNSYNTYKYKGLPPGPISIVSLDSLEAALNPVSTNYLYFVSKGDGSHKFSKTLSEHNKAVLKYQINAR